MAIISLRNGFECQTLPAPADALTLASTKFIRKRIDCGIHSFQQSLPRDQELSVQSVLRRYGLEKEYDPAIPWETRSVLGKILACRTGAYGKTTYECDQCGSGRSVYTHCQNRHCTACGWLKRKKWLDEVLAWDLPTTYFHTVFTAPHDLNKLFRANQVECYRLFFQCVKETLLERCAEAYSCKPGIIMTLHTWGQQLLTHVHVHVIMTAGGVSIEAAEPRRWISIADQSPAMEAQWLADDFRSRFVKGLRSLHRRGKLAITEGFLNSLHPVDGYSFTTLLHRLEQINWRAHTELTPETSKTTNGCIKYVATYTTGAAIHDGRIVSDDGRRVTYKYWDYKTDLNQQETLPGEEFVDRFLLHIVPSGVYRIRYAGLFTAYKRRTAIANARPLLLEYNQQNQATLHPAIVNNTYNSNQYAKRNPENCEDDNEEKNLHQPICWTCHSPGMRRIEHLKPQATRDAMRRLRNWMTHFDFIVTTLDDARLALFRQSQRLAQMASQPYQPTFLDHAYARNLANTFTETNIDCQVDDSIHSHTIGQSCGEIRCEDGKACCTEIVATTHRPATNDTMLAPSPSETVIGRLVGYVGYIALVTLHPQSVMDTIAYATRVLACKQNRPCHHDLFRTQRFLDIFQVQWAESIDRKTVLLGQSALGAACTRSILGSGAVSNYASVTLPLPNW